MSDNLDAEIGDIVSSHAGWCTVEKAVAMAELVLCEKPDLVVEIGVYGGRSLFPQAMALRKNQRGIAYGIDSWSSEFATEGENDKTHDDWWRELDLDLLHRRCVEAVRRLRLENHCVLLRCPSHSCHHRFRQIDILHIDGNHSELASVRDVELYLPLVRPRGFVWFDDTNWETTRRALELLGTMAVQVDEVGACALFRKL